MASITAATGSTSVGSIDEVRAHLRGHRRDGSRSVRSAITFHAPSARAIADGEQADRPAPDHGDGVRGDVLAAAGAERRVHGVAERLHDRRDVGLDALAHDPRVRGRASPRTRRTRPRCRRPGSAGSRRCAPVRSGRSSSARTRCGSRRRRTRRARGGGPRADGLTVPATSWPNVIGTAAIRPSAHSFQSRCAGRCRRSRRRARGPAPLRRRAGPGSRRARPRHRGAVLRSARIVPARPEGTRAAGNRSADATMRPKPHTDPGGPDHAVEAHRRTVALARLLAGACANSSRCPRDGATGVGATGGPRRRTRDRPHRRRRSGAPHRVRGRVRPVRVPPHEPAVVLALRRRHDRATPGPQIEIYPGPALPAIDASTPDARGDPAILIDAAFDAGLDTDRELHDWDRSASRRRRRPCSRSTSDGQTHTSDVYALGFDLRSRPTGDARTRFEARKRSRGFRATLPTSRLAAGGLRDGRRHVRADWRSGSSSVAVSSRRDPPAASQSRGRSTPDSPGSATPPERSAGMRCGTVAATTGPTLLPLARAGEPAHAVDERRRAVRAVVPAPAAGRVGLLTIGESRPR